MIIDSCYGQVNPGVHPVSISVTPLFLTIFIVGLLVGYVIPGIIFGWLVSRWYYRDAKFIAYSRFQPRETELHGFRSGVYIKSVPQAFWDDLSLLVEHCGSGTVSVPVGETKLFYRVLDDYLTQCPGICIEADAMLSIRGEYRVDDERPDVNQLLSPKAAKAAHRPSRQPRRIQLD